MSSVGSRPTCEAWAGPLFGVPRSSKATGSRPDSGQKRPKWLHCTQVLLWQGHPENTPKVSHSEKQWFHACFLLSVASLKYYEFESLQAWYVGTIINILVEVVKLVWFMSRSTQLSLIIAYCGKGKWIHLLCCRKGKWVDLPDDPEYHWQGTLPTPYRSKGSWSILILLSIIKQA